MIESRHEGTWRDTTRTAARAAVLASVLAIGGCAVSPSTPSGAPPPSGPPAAAGPAAAAPRGVPPAASACPTPAFPESVRRGEASGLTRVSGDVQPDGSVRAVVIVRSSGPTRAHKLLDRTAADALSRCRFPPAPGTAPATTTVDYRWAGD